MDRLIQQVNLYQPIFRRQHKPFSAGVMGVYLGIAILVMLGVTLTGFLQVKQLEQKTAELLEQKNHMQAKVDALKSTLKPREKNQLLLAKKDRLTDDLRNARRLSKLLTSEIEQQGRAYSAYFQGLAESVVDGLWLKSVRIEQGGEYLSLSGQTLQPELVPRLLQLLSSQQAFEGHSFGNVKMSRQNTEGLELPVIFQLETLKSGEGQSDAG